MRDRLLKYIFYVFCSVGILLFGSCQTTRNQTHKSKKYHTLRTRHTPHWNATTSQNTTYYIKKNSTRKNGGNMSHKKVKSKARNKHLDHKINKC